MYKTTTIVICTLILLLNFSPSIQAAPKLALSPAELIAGVNQLRQSNGLNPLAANTLLTISAQSHSEYQSSLGYWTHEGPGGTNETDRAYSVGYGNGASIACDEAVAIASGIKDINYIIYDLWNDAIHRDIVLLNSRYLEIGAGVAEGSDGLFYYTVNLCVIEGQTTADIGQSTAATSAATQNPNVTATYAPIPTQAPQEDGSIWHTVRLGETVFDVAFAYGISELELETMNGISPAYPIIYEGQILLIKGAPLPTATATSTNTPAPPTQTPKPTFTPSPTRPTATASVTPTITPTPTQPPAILVALDNIEKRHWGIIILAVSVLGLVSLLIFNPNKRSTATSEEVQESESPVEEEGQTPPTEETENKPETSASE